MVLTESQQHDFFCVCVNSHSVLANPDSLSTNSPFYSRFFCYFCLAFQEPWAAGQNLKCRFPLHCSPCCFTWCVWCFVQFTSLYAHRQKVYAISAVCPGSQQLEWWCWYLHSCVVFCLPLQRSLIIPDFQWRWEHALITVQNVLLIMAYFQIKFYGDFLCVYLNYYL